MGSSLAGRGRLLLQACAALAAVLTVQRAAEASCGPPSCSIVVVDASCQAVPSGQPVSGDPLSLEIKCTTLCCAGASTCGQNPYDVAPDLLGLKKYEISQGVETLSTDSVSSFSAHASCPDVYVSQACIPPGKYAVQVTSGMTASDVEVTQGDCPDADAGANNDAGAQPADDSSSDSGCSVAEPAHGGASPLWLLALLGGVGAFRRRRLS